MMDDHFNNQYPSYNRSTKQQHHRKRITLPRLNNLAIISLCSLVFASLLLSIYLASDMVGLRNKARVERRTRGRPVLPRGNLMDIAAVQAPSHTSKEGLANSGIISPSKPTPPATPKWSNFAIALKTGREVSSNRVPIQMLTFLSDVEQLIIIGESEGAVGNVTVHDVYTGLYGIVDADTKAPNSKRQAGRSPAASSQKSAAQHPPAPQNAKDSIIVDKSSIGWKSDAHKNLPGFRLLQATYPTSDWYIMIDDDTYLVLENLQAHLSAHFPDPEIPVYLGNPNHFVGCDGISKMGMGTAFAHGGSGIVVSRGAMRLMIGGIDDCIVRYRRFNIEPPNIMSEGSWPRDPCTRPFTFHHLLPWQIQTLYNAHTKARRRAAAHLVDDYTRDSGMTFADVLHAFRATGTAAGQATDWTSGRDRPGLDYKTVVFQGARDDAHAAAGTVVLLSLTHSLIECRTICIGESACRSWSFVGKKCWLKDGIAQSEPREGAHSGVDFGEYLCARG